MAWRIPWTVHSMGLQRVRHDGVTFTHTHTHTWELPAQVGTTFELTQQSSQALSPRTEDGFPILRGSGLQVSSRVICQHAKNC